jgi:hypothetical protein
LIATIGFCYSEYQKTSKINESAKATLELRT